MNAFSPCELRVERFFHSELRVERFVSTNPNPNPNPNPSYERLTFYEPKLASLETSQPSFHRSTSTSYVFIFKE